MDAFSALADPVRRDLLSAVAAAPSRVVDLAGRHPISRPAVSRHLRVLSDAGLVEADDRGRERHYRLSPAGLEPVLAFATGLAVRPRVESHHLDALDLEVRRTVRERRASDAVAQDAVVQGAGTQDAATQDAADQEEIG